MKPNQVVATGAVSAGSTLFVKEASKTFQQTTKAEDLCYKKIFVINKHTSALELG